jgi:hypothetical protein
MADAATARTLSLKPNSVQQEVTTGSTITARTRASPSAPEADAVLGFGIGAMSDLGSVLYFDYLPYGLLNTPLTYPARTLLSCLCVRGVSVSLELYTGVHTTLSMGLVTR